MNIKGLLVTVTSSWGIKPEGNRYLKCDYFKDAFTLFPEYLFLIPYCVVFLFVWGFFVCFLFSRNQNEDKNYNRLIVSLESLYIFGALKKGEK